MFEDAAPWPGCEAFLPRTQQQLRLTQFTSGARGRRRTESIEAETSGGSGLCVLGGALKSSCTVLEGQRSTECGGGGAASTTRSPPNTTTRPPPSPTTATLSSPVCHTHARLTHTTATTNAHIRWWWLIFDNSARKWLKRKCWLKFRLSKKNRNSMQNNDPSTIFKGAKRPLKTAKSVRTIWLLARWAHFAPQSTFDASHVFLWRPIVIITCFA